MADPDNLQRFVDAQEPVYDAVRAELRAGHKTGHWIWFIFPQLTGLGTSPTAEFYGIDSLAQARAYLDHPVLGPRLIECANLLLGYPGPRPIGQILGGVDAMKLRSSMTLFLAAAGDGAAFAAVLDRYYGGEPDDLTLQWLRRAAGSANRAAGPPPG